MKKLGYRNQHRTPEDTIKITSSSDDRVNEIADKILELFRCVVSPVKDGDRGTVYLYLTVIGEVVE